MKSPAKPTLKQLGKVLSDAAKARDRSVLAEALAAAARELRQQQLAAGDTALRAPHSDVLLARIRTLGVAEGVPDDSPFVRYLLEVAADGTIDTLRTALFGAIAEIAAHERRSKNKYPLAYWPRDFVARLAADPKNTFEKRLRDHLAQLEQRS